MAGRGGRGAALLRALEEPARKPGDHLTGSGDHASQAQPSVAPPVTPAAPGAANAGRGGGRGSYLLSLIPSTSEPDAPTSAGVPIPSSSSSSTSQQQSKIKPTGRAASLIEMCGPSPTRPVRQVKPLSPQPPNGNVPTSSMRTLNLSEAPEQPAPTPQPQRTPASQKPPQRGQAGNRIPLCVNYIRLKAKHSSWFQYSVSYTPNIDSRGLRYKLLYMHENVIGPARIFDGTVLFLPHELSSKVTTLFSVNEYTNENITVKVTQVKKISIADTQCIQMYNVLFKRIMNILNLVQIGTGASFDQNAAISIPQHKLQIWPGYVTKVEEYDGGLLLVCDVAHRVLREQTAYNVMDAILKDPRVTDKRKKILSELVGKRVITRYNNKNYLIDDISFDISPLSTFERREGPITYVEYYKSHYGKTIAALNQPMLISRPKQKDGEQREQLMCLLPELSYMTGLTDEMTQNYRVMKDIAQHTRVSPQNRQAGARAFIQRVKNCPQAYEKLAMWGLELDDNPLELEGRNFNPEKIYFGNKQVGSAGVKADWTRDVSNKPVTNAVDLKNWVMVFTQRDCQKALNYLTNYQKIASQLGISISQPRDIQLPDDRTETYVRACREAVNRQVQLVVVLIPTKREDKYNAVKKVLCVERPCPSQVIITKTISDERKLRSVVQKIGLQINAKLGGELWQLHIPLRNTMYVGIDVYHDGAKGKGRSVAGLVASLNAAATRYYSRVTTQAPGEELINGLKICFSAALRKYHSIHNILPDKIIVYRDGVSNSMLATLNEHEVNQLSSCFNNFEQYREQRPGLTVVVVQKRISTKIFSCNKKGIDNPPPGTVLDHTVTNAKWYDYYLVSQHVTQGSVTPTHYIVVHDTAQLKVDNLQQLSYKMCHLYYNWSGTIRVPAPVQYAHKLAYLIGENVRNDPSESLADKLYYL